MTHVLSKSRFPKVSWDSNYLTPHYLIWRRNLYFPGTLRRTEMLTWLKVNHRIKSKMQEKKKHKYFLLTVQCQHHRFKNISIVDRCSVSTKTPHIRMMYAHYLLLFLSCIEVIQSGGAIGIHSLSEEFFFIILMIETGRWMFGTSLSFCCETACSRHQACTYAISASPLPPRLISLIRQSFFYNEWTKVLKCYPICKPT